MNVASLEIGRDSLKAPFECCIYTPDSSMLRPTFLPPPLDAHDIEGGFVPADNLPITCMHDRPGRRCRYLVSCLVLFLLVVPLGDGIASLFDLNSDVLHWIPMIIIRIVRIVVALLIVVTPGVCFALLCLWNWAAPNLPSSEGKVGSDIVNQLWFAICACCGILAILPTWWGQYLSRCFLFAYTVTGIIFGAYAVLISPLVKRVLYVCSLAIPISLRYTFLQKWSKGVGLSEKEENAAYTRLHEVYATPVYEAAVELGGIWVKSGQKLASVPILPPAYNKKLKQLQNSVPPRDESVIKQLISTELQQPLETVFARFDAKPLGAASIGQVHSAILRDGREVVVKVQYPEVQDTVHLDLRLMGFLMKLMGQEAACADLTKNTLEELDFVKEASNLDRVYEGLRHTFPDVKTPIPIRGLCTRKVLVMTRVEGVSLMDAAVRMVQVLAKVTGMGDMSVDEVMEKMVMDPKPEADVPAEVRRKEWRMLNNLVAALDTALSEETKGKLVQAAISTGRAATNVSVALYNHSASIFGAKRLEAMPAFDMSELSLKIWRVFGHSIFNEGFMNADPHPGNILVDEKSGRLGLIDFGTTIELTVEIRVKLARVLLTVSSSGDEFQIAQAFAQLGIRTPYMGSGLIARLAQFYFGSASLSPSSIRDLKELAEEEGGGEPDLGEAYTMIVAIGMLRGSSMCLGTAATHYPAALWLDHAQAFLVEHGAQYPVGKLVELNIRQGSAFARRIPQPPRRLLPRASVYYDAEES